MTGNEFPAGAEALTDPGELAAIIAVSPRDLRTRARRDGTGLLAPRAM